MNVPKISLMLDSGAFGAWKRGTTINLQNYIDYIKAHRHLISSYVSLDVIPKYGQGERSRAMEYAASQSYENHQIMKGAGLTPIPIYHQGENIAWLDRYLDDNEPYIGISPYARTGESDAKSWFDTCFSVVTDSQGNPLVKTHGFGATNPDLVLRYPWASVDSTTWILVGGYGKIIVPQFIHGGIPDFSDPIHISISEVRGEDGWETYSKMEQVYVIRWLEKCGTTLDKARQEFLERQRVNIAFFLALEKVCNSYPQFIHRKPTFFNNKGSKRRSIKRSTKMIFAANYATRMNVMLNVCGIENRLLSYFDLSKRKAGYLENYLATGLPGKLGVATGTRPRVKEQTLWDAAQ